MIGIAEDQDHLEKYFDKRTRQTYGTVLTKNGKMKLNAWSTTAMVIITL